MIVLRAKGYAKPCYEPLWTTKTNNNPQLPNDPLCPTMIQNIHTMTHYHPKRSKLFYSDLKQSAVTFYFPKCRP